MSKLVKKAVIPAAGLGTRFLPATKVVPKELLPIVDIPIIQLIVEEAVASGIEDIVIITGPEKSSLEGHFKSIPALEKKLESLGHNDLLKRLTKCHTMANISTVIQDTPRGLGHAILCAKDAVGDESFAVLLGDDVVDAATPCTRQMIEVFEQQQKSVVGLMRIQAQDVDQFGICGGHTLSDRIYELDTMVEKPTMEQAPSNLAIVGRYILKPSIFKYLQELKPNNTPGAPELELTNAMEKMMKVEGFIGYEFIGDRYDAGDNFGFLQANLAFALKRRDLGPRLLSFMQDMLDRGRL